MLLSEVEKAQNVVIDSFVNEELEVKLLEFGLAIGSSVFIEHKAPFGGPLLLNTSSGNIALRQNEAQMIKIKPAHG
ncbi:ferrous iron transport protein A [Cyclobacteriaceae bacterium]|nr:ferrous iron transport protein A [Cyclobacteriaceae bacterium]